MSETEAGYLTALGLIVGCYGFAQGLAWVLIRRARRGGTGSDL